MNSIVSGKKIRISEDLVFAFLPGIYYIFNTLKLVTGNSMIPFGVLLVVGCLGLIYVWKKNTYRFLPFHIFSIVFIVFTAINMMITGNLDLMDYFASILLLGVTAMMLSYRWEVRHGAITFYVTAALMVLGYIRDSENILTISSNNYVSVLLVLSVAMYYIPFEWNGRKMQVFDLIPAFLTFVLSVLASGRGGMISAALLLVCIIAIYFMDKLKVYSKVVLIFIIAIGLFVGIEVAFGGILTDKIMSLGNWKTKGVASNSRLRLWRAYWNKSIESPLYFILGSPLSDIPYAMKFNRNCHNSFIQLHAYSGIFSLIIMFVYMIRSAVLYIKNHHLILFSMLLVLFVRGMTDKFIFAQYGMPMMLFLIIFPLLGRNKSEEAN